MVTVLDADEHRFAQLLAKSSNASVRDIGVTTLATADLIKVGPKGYIHGWIHVGAGVPGTSVLHPQHGHGTVSRIDEHGHAHVTFDNGKKHSFEHVAGAGPGRLTARTKGTDAFSRHLDAAGAANRRKDHAGAAEHYRQAADATTHPAIAAEMRQRATEAAAKTPQVPGHTPPKGVPGSVVRDTLRTRRLHMQSDPGRAAIDEATRMHDAGRSSSQISAHLRASGDKLRRKRTGDRGLQDAEANRLHGLAGLVDSHEPGSAEAGLGGGPRVAAPSKVDGHVAAANAAVERGDRAAAINHLMAAANAEPDKKRARALRDRQVALSAQEMGRLVPADVARRLAGGGGKPKAPSRPKVDAPHPAGPADRLAQHESARAERIQRTRAAFESARAAETRSRDAMREKYGADASKWPTSYDGNPDAVAHRAATKASEAANRDYQDALPFTREHAAAIAASEPKIDAFVQAAKAKGWPVSIGAILPSGEEGEHFKPAVIMRTGGPGGPSHQYIFHPKAKGYTYDSGVVGQRGLSYPKVRDLLGVGGVSGPKVDAPQVTGPAAHDQAVRDAYTRLAAEPGAWVGLADLRRELHGIPRDQQDAALRRLEQAPDANVVPESNQKTLSEAQRAAAVVIGDQPKHMVAIGGPSLGAAAPSPPATARGGAPSAGEVHTALRQATTRDDARNYLNGLKLKAPQMRQLARDLGVPVRSSDSKAEMRRLLVEVLAGSRLDSDAMARIGHIR